MGNSLGAEDRRVAYPQLPTSIGLAVGTQSFSLYPERYQFAYARCRKAGIDRAALTAEEEAALDRDCDALQAQAEDYRSFSHPTHGRRFTRWDREFPGDWVVGLPLPADLPEARRVVAWLGEKEGRPRLLDHHSFANAPVPGLGGFTPAEYLSRRVHHAPLRVLRAEERARSAQGAAGEGEAPRRVDASEGLNAYCALLRDAFPEAVGGEVAERCAQLRSAWKGPDP